MITGARLRPRFYNNEILLDPNCTKGIQHGLLCVLLTEPGHYSEAASHCSRQDFQLWQPDNQNITLDLHQLFTGTNRYWILNAGKILTHGALNNLLFSLIVMDVMV